MPQTVERLDEISLNEVRFPILGPVQATLASIYPSKVVIGDTTRDSQQRLSVLAKSDWRGGIGLEIMEGAGEVDRAWWSTAQLRHTRHLTLPPLATQTSASGVSGVFTVGKIGELASFIYASFETSIRKYDDIADSWGNSLATLPAVATDTITMRLNGTVFMIFFHKTGYTYTSDGSSFTDDTEDIQFATAWDDRLWGIDKTGQLRYSLVIGAWTDDAMLPLPDDSVTDLFVGRDSFGEPIIYCMTTVGLWAHDANNSSWVQTEFGLPTHPDNGKGTERFRGATYIPAGLSIYKYQDGSSPAVITLVGPDRDDGVPADRRGAIRAMTASHNELIAATDATTAKPAGIFHTTGMASHGAGGFFASNAISAAIGFSYILGWDGKGWQVKWLSSVSDRAINDVHVSNAYSKYRLWWAIDERVWFMRLDRDITNPRQIGDFPYDTAFRHEEPWFDAGQSEVDKIAVRLKIEVRDMSSTETIRPYFAVNYSETWTQLSEITSDGVSTYSLPNITAGDTTTVSPTGTEFRAIRFRVDGARGSMASKAPAVISITLEYRKKLSVTGAWNVHIDLTKPYGGLDQVELRAALVAAVASNPLLEFTYRDDSGEGRNYFVDVASATDLEATGHDEAGTSRVLLVEA